MFAISDSLQAIDEFEQGLKAVDEQKQ